MIARVMLFLPVGRYVDDYFSVERCAIRPVIRRVVLFHAALLQGGDDGARHDRIRPVGAAFAGKVRDSSQEAGVWLPPDRIRHGGEVRLARHAVHSSTGESGEMA